MATQSLRFTPLAALALIAPASVSAQALTATCPPDFVGCSMGDVDFQHRDALFDDVMLDTGWVPAGSPVQVRFAVFVGGSTQVDMGGTGVAWWPPPLEAQVIGRPTTGRLAINYGIEIIARVRFDVEAGGSRYTWEGDIPLGDIPRDLRVAAEATFDPFLLPPSEPRPVMVADDTEMVTVVEYDITDSLVPIPGIGGGIVVDAIASLEASYQTDRIVITDAVEDILTEAMSVIVRPPMGTRDFGAFKDLEILPHGTIDYLGLLTVYPRLFIEIVGRRWDLTLAEIPIPIADLSTQTDFNTDIVHVPLPDIQVDPVALDFGTVPEGSSAERLLMVENAGEEPLHVTVSEPAAPITASRTTFTIAPRTTARLAVTFQAVGSGDIGAELAILSNDPDEPVVSVWCTGRVGPAIVGSDDAGTLPDAGIGDDAGVGGGVVTDGGCGCRVGPSSRAPWLYAIAFAAVIIRVSRARRRSARGPRGSSRPTSRS